MAVSKIVDEELTIEDCFNNMEDIISSLEDKNVSLEDSFELYKKGMEYLKVCNSKIDTVEKEVMKINASGEMEAFDGLE